MTGIIIAIVIRVVRLFPWLQYNHHSSHYSLIFSSLQNPLEILIVLTHKTGVAVYLDRHPIFLYFLQLIKPVRIFLRSFAHAKNQQIYELL